ncbi:uncharacterized protein LOC126318646 [Schistocerca gregaria]|uniref:uncharacterized protein LOC126318646 n=1 Tax=Schistocerca gregaria TaxID=7010 RepID=UPI00211DDA70|nr:uncharacterized protein LOC126318646 [Schistocerca gregaria]
MNFYSQQDKTLIDLVVQSIGMQLDPSCDQNRRQELAMWTDEFKRTNDAARLSFFLIHASQPAPVRYFGMTVLEYHVRLSWESEHFTQSQRQSICSSLLEMICSDHTDVLEEPSYLKNKLCELLLHLFNWPVGENLLSSFLRSSLGSHPYDSNPPLMQRGQYQQEMIVRLFGMLAERILRKKESELIYYGVVLSKFNECFSCLLNALHRLLCHYANTYQIHVSSCLEPCLLETWSSLEPSVDEPVFAQLDREGKVSVMLISSIGRALEFVVKSNTSCLSNVGADEASGETANSGNNWMAIITYLLEQPPFRLQYAQILYLVLAKGAMSHSEFLYFWHSVPDLKKIAYKYQKCYEEDFACFPNQRSRYVQRIYIQRLCECLCAIATAYLDLLPRNELAMPNFEDILECVLSMSTGRSLVLFFLTHSFWKRFIHCKHFQEKAYFKSAVHVLSKDLLLKLSFFPFEFSENMFAPALLHLVRLLDFAMDEDAYQEFVGPYRQSVISNVWTPISRLFPNLSLNLCHYYFLQLSDLFSQLRSVDDRWAERPEKRILLTTLFEALSKLLIAANQHVLPAAHFNVVPSPYVFPGMEPLTNGPRAVEYSMEEFKHVNGVLLGRITHLDTGYEPITELQLRMVLSFKGYLTAHPNVLESIIFYYVKYMAYSNCSADAVDIQTDLHASVENLPFPTCTPETLPRCVQHLRRIAATCLVQFANTFSAYMLPYLDKLIELFTSWISARRLSIFEVLSCYQLIVILSNRLSCEAQERFLTTLCSSQVDQWRSLSLFDNPSQFFNFLAGDSSSDDNSIHKKKLLSILNQFSAIWKHVKVRISPQPVVPLRTARPGSSDAFGRKPAQTPLDDNDLSCFENLRIHKHCNEVESLLSRLSDDVESINDYMMKLHIDGVKRSTEHFHPLFEFDKLICDNLFKFIECLHQLWEPSVRSRYKSPLSRIYDFNTRLFSTHFSNILTKHNFSFFSESQQRLLQSEGCFDDSLFFLNIAENAYIILGSIIKHQAPFYTNLSQPFSYLKKIFSSLQHVHIAQINLSIKHAIVNLAYYTPQDLYADLTDCLQHVVQLFFYLGSQKQTHTVTSLSQAFRCMSLAPAPHGSSAYSMPEYEEIAMDYQFDLFYHNLFALIKSIVYCKKGSTSEPCTSQFISVEQSQNSTSDDLSQLSEKKSRHDGASGATLYFQHLLASDNLIWLLQFILDMAKWKMGKLCIHVLDLLLAVIKTTAEFDHTHNLDGQLLNDLFDQSSKCQHQRTSDSTRYHLVGPATCNWISSTCLMSLIADHLQAGSTEHKKIVLIISHILAFCPFSSFKTLRLLRQVTAVELDALKSNLKLNKKAKVNHNRNRQFLKEFFERTMNFPNPKAEKSTSKMLVHSSLNKKIRVIEEDSDPIALEDTWAANLDDLF